MDSRSAEYRRYRRVYFQREQVVTGVLADIEARPADLPVKVLNLSEGGLFFTVKKNEVGDVAPGATLTLRDLRGPHALLIPEEIHLEIKWVSNDPLLENVGCGCEFIDLPLSSQQQIRELIAGLPAESAGAQ